MAGFEDLIRGTLQKHGNTTPQSRAAIYDSSRQALERMLSQNQKLDLAAQSLQRQRLEKAIADIEAGYVASASPVAPVVAPTATEPAAIQPTVPTRPMAPETPTAPVAAPPTSVTASAAPTVAPSLPQSSSRSPSPPPIPVFRPEPAAPVETPAGAGIGRIEPGVDVPPIPVPPTAPRVTSEDVAPTVATDAYSEAVAATERNDRKPYAKLLLWAIIVAGVGVSIWWAINFGPALLKQQLGGSVPNPGQTIESGQFVPGAEGEGWVTAFDPATDSINIDTGGFGTAEVFQNANETYVRLASNAGGNDNNIKILMPRGVMLPLKGAAATIEVVMKSSAKASQEFAVYCEFGTMGSCGRKRFTASARPDAQIFDVLLNNIELAADEDAYLTFNSDLGGEGRAIDIYAIRVRLNK